MVKIIGAALLFSSFSGVSAQAATQAQSTPDRAEELRRLRQEQEDRRIIWKEIAKKDSPRLKRSKSKS